MGGAHEHPVDGDAGAFGGDPFCLIQYVGPRAEIVYNAEGDGGAFSV